MPEARRAPRAPWIVAAAAGVAVVVLLVLFFVPLNKGTATRVPGQLTGDEQHAVSAAATEAVNLTSYTRANFAKNYARAVDGSTGALQKDVTSNRAMTLKTLTQGKFDTSAQVVNQALVGTASSGSTFVVLVSLNTYKSTSPGVPVPYHLQITIERKGNKYLASNLKSVELS